MSADDPFCPRHGRQSRPIEIPGLRCDENTHNCPQIPLPRSTATAEQIIQDMQLMIKKQIDNTSPKRCPTCGAGPHIPGSFCICGI